jgi:Acyclic terpene utilisation family protein AtuA
MSQFAKAHPTDPVDVIISDYMSEGNMPVSAARKLASSAGATSPGTILDVSGPAFEPSFLEALEPALEDLAKHGIKVAVNAGASDTEGLYNVVVEMIKKKGLDIKCAWISGDEVLPQVDASLKNGTSQFKNIYTGEILKSWEFEPIYAQAYLGGLGIAEAFSQGAQIVICGRVSDASPVIGAAYWFHKWKRDQLSELANTFVAGHLIECSNYVCGGNFTGFKSLEHSPGGWSDIGYPIAEISANGQVVITKQQNSGGAVTVDTCSSQLVYEIQGPWYYNSDVTAVLDSIWFEQLGANRVALRGVKALPPPPTTKVGLTARGGFQAEAMYFMTGLDVQAKARMLEAQLRKSLAPYSNKFSMLSFSVLGTPGVDADNQNAATAVFRIFAQAPEVGDIIPGKFLRPIIDNIMQGYPGSTFHLDFRQGLPKPYFEYYVTLLPQSQVKHFVHYNGKDTLIDPPTTTKTFLDRQPSTESTSSVVSLNSFGPTQRLPLGTIVHARSGDKGSDCNCGFWVRYADEYAWLQNLLSISTIKQLLGKEYDTSRRPKIEVDRFELPNLRGVHFLFRNLLDRGVTSTGSVDFLGKNCAEFLRSRYVDIPVKFLNRGKL